MTRIRQLYRRWLQQRLPPASRQRLTQRSIFIVPTGFGALFMLQALVLFVVGMNTRNNLLLGLALLLFALFCVALLHTFRNLAGLSIEVLATHGNFRGDMGRVRLRLDAEREHVSLEIGWEGEAARVISLQPGACLELELCFRLVRRGWNRPPRLRLQSRYPLGLARTWSLPSLEAATLGWPVPLAGGDCPSRGLSGGQLRRLEAGDTALIDRYQPGDNPRHIDWKAYARGAGLRVRRVQLDYPNAWLDWTLLPTQDAAIRRRRLSYWVLQLEAGTGQWGLRLPSAQLGLGRGDAHLLAAMRLLALEEEL